MSLAIIVAMARNRVIGKDGTLPWHIPEDLKHFKRTTLGHAVIMGRKTFESIGKPLPKRRNIVVSRNPDARFEGCETATNLADAIAIARAGDGGGARKSTDGGANDMPFVIGGARLFEEALTMASHVYLTLIDRDYEGDVFFPEHGLEPFVVTERRPAETDNDVTFATLERS